MIPGWLTLVHVTALVAMTSACSEPLGGYVEPSVDEKVRYANVVLYGRAVATYPGDESTTYTVTMHVYCTLRGPRLPVSVNVSEAGFVPGHCESHDFSTGRDYVVFAYSHMMADNTLKMTPNDVEEEPGGDFMRQLAAVCHLHPEAPLAPRDAKLHAKCANMSFIPCKHRFTTTAPKRPVARGSVGATSELVSNASTPALNRGHYFLTLLLLHRVVAVTAGVTLS